MNDEVSAFTWLVWALILLMGIALLHHQGWNRWLAGSQYIFEEGQACAWIFGRACWLPGKPCHWWHTEGLHNILIYVGVMLFNFFFLPLLGMILLVPVLAAINARYAIVAGRPSDGIVNVASLAGVLLLALILAVPMFLIAYRSLRSQERPWRRIRRCKALTGMEELLDLPRLADSLRSEVTQILAEHVDPDRPYLISREGLPLLHATAMGFRVVGMPTLDQCRVDRFAEWVISGAHPKGGFGPQPGKTPDPHHTLSACQILAGRLTETERRIHRKWVRRQILLYTIHHRDWPASERWFYDVACLCDALVRLQTDSMSLQRIRAVVIPGVQHMWSRSGQTTRQARDLCTTLQLLSSEHSSIRQDLSRRWLPLHVASLPTLNPEQRLEQIEDVLIVLRWVDGRGLRERDEVCIVRDNLARTVSAALMNP